MRGLNPLACVSLAFSQPLASLCCPGYSVTLTASHHSTAATFMEHWKRKQMRLNYRWDLTGFEEEEVSGCACPPQGPLCHLLWLTWRPQVLTGPWSQARLLWLLHSSPWYSLVARATVFHLPVFSVSMLPKTQHPPVWARVLARVSHTDLITSGAVGCGQEITAVHRPPSSLCSIQTIPQPAVRGG